MTALLSGLLRRYFGEPFCGPSAAVGAAFDTWDSTGTRSEDVDRFTADDLVAVTFLSVDVPPRAARLLLRDAQRRRVRRPAHRGRARS